MTVCLSRFFMLSHHSFAMVSSVVKEALDTRFYGTKLVAPFDPSKKPISTFKNFIKVSYCFMTSFCARAELLSSSWLKNENGKRQSTTSGEVGKLFRAERWWSATGLTFMLQFIVHNINLRRRHCEQWQRKIFYYVSITASPALPSSASWKAANWISFKSGFSKGIRKEVVEHEANHKLRTEGKTLDNAQRMSSSFHCDPTEKFPLLLSRRAAYLNEFNFPFEVRRGTKHFSSLSCSATSHLLFRARRFRPFYDAKRKSFDFKRKVFVRNRADKAFNPKALEGPSILEKSSAPKARHVECGFS